MRRDFACHGLQPLNQVQKLKDFCNETADLIVHLYGWSHMPVSLHKALVNGSSVEEALSLPLGKLREEAQEAHNKDFREFCLHNARKDTHLHTMLE